MLIGKRINDRYKLLEMVGGGGMANVYLARDVILERDVALKILRMDFNHDQEFIKRFNREAHSATSLAHENIVSIYDVGEDGDIYYIVMEYVEGLTLKQYIQKNYPIPIETALDIMKQITAAMAHAHHNGIIHRDIKPQNILVDHDGNVKITDFGIAIALSSTNITQTNAVLGSVHYLSPEQARGGMANKKSDIYSLGIVMFELLTGRLPFSGESAISIALKHLQSETPSPKRWNPEIPQSVENIILKATAKDSDYRYSSVEEMEEDIQTALDPSRQNEAPFTIPDDAEATKAIPIVMNDQLNNLDETIIRTTDKTQPSDDEIDEDTKTVKKGKKKKAKKERKKRKKWPIVILSFLLLIVLGVGIVIAFPSILGTKEVVIPELEGKEVDEAIEELLNLGLEIGETRQMEHDEIPAGHIIRTTPNEGRTVKVGTTVTLVESTGPEKIEVPDYVGEDYSTIKSALEQMGFSNIKETYKHSDEGPEGTILEQKPAAGEEVVPQETEIELFISLGQEKISVKNLEGYSEAGLRDYEKESGLKIVVEKEEYHNTVKEGLVIRQSPKGGTSVAKGSTINVVMSKGKEEIPPKTVTKKVMIEYEPEKEGNAQQVLIFIEDLDHDMDEPVESFIMVHSREFTLELLVSKDKPGRYKIIRDDKVIIEEDVPYPD